MNGTDFKFPPQLPPNPLVELLQNVLNDAKAGNISSVAMVIVTPQAGVATPYLGPQRGDLFIGASLLTKRMLDDIATPQQRSPIIRAVPAG